MLRQRCKNTNNSAQLRTQPKHNKDGDDQMSSRQVQATAIAGESRAYHFKADAGSYVHAGKEPRDGSCNDKPQRNRIKSLTLS